MIILFLLNSTKTIQWAADTYAPQYGFGYKKISGGLLTGIEVEALTFKDDLLLDNLKVGWNPAAILYKKISITHLETKGLNVANIKKPIEAFIPAESKEKNTRAIVLPVTIGVGELYLSVKPFDESGIGFKNISLEGEDIVYDGEEIDIDDLSLLMDTNVATLKLNGSKDGKKIKIKTLSVLDLDTTAFQHLIDKMIEINIYKDITEYVEPEIENYKAGRENKLPNNIEIDSFIVITKPGDHPRLRLNRGELNATSVKVDIYGIIDLQSDTLEMQSYSMLLDTSLGSLSMKSKLEGERIIVDSLSLQDIDTVALTQFVKSIENNQTYQSEFKVPHKDESIETNSMTNSLLPKYLYVKHMDSSIKNVAYNNLLVKSAEVNATNVLLNMRTFIAESGEVDVNAVSDLVSLSQHGVIKDNHIKGMGQLIVHKELFKMYDLPLNKATFDPIAMKMMVDKKQVVIDFDLKDGELLQRQKSVFTVENLSLTNQIVYRFSEGKLSIKNEGNISTLYAKELNFENLLTLNDGVLDYKGKVIPGLIEGIDSNYTKPLNDLIITYQGDTKSIEARIESEGLEGKLISADLKKGDLALSTKQAFELKNFISLPKALNASTASVDMHLPLDFSAIFPLKANAKISSNLASVDADIVYDKEWKVMSKTIFPEDSLLRTLSPKLNLDALSPLEADLSIFEKFLHMDIRSKGLTSKVKFDLENKNLDGNMVLAGAEFIFKGNVEKELSLTNSVSSLEGLLQKLSTIYAFEVPPLDGDVKVALIMTDMQDVVLQLHSNTLLYSADHTLNDTMVSLGYSGGEIVVKEYHTTIDKNKFFSTKPSLITWNEGNIEIAPLWINDGVKVKGTYNTETQKGEFLASADSFKSNLDIANLENNINLKTSIDEDKTSVEGTVTILGGEIHYDMNIKTFSSDRDIVNAEELKKKKNSVFMDNLTTSININTEKPFIYKTEEIDMKANADLWLQKVEKGPLRMLGMVEILEGSWYRFKDKKFGLKKGTISFTGDPNKLILDIVAIYKTVQAEISIHVTGSPTNPEIVLSSIPPMDRQKILSTILFGTQENEQDMSEDDMMNMMGDTMAKSVFSNTGTGIVKSAFSTVGINIDAIPFIGDSADADQSEKKLFSFFSREEKVRIPHHEIHFNGQKDVDEKALQKAMGVDTKSIFQFWKDDKPTINDKLLPTLEQSLRNFYDSKGFYDAAFSIETSKTDVIVNIKENEPVKINDINISSDHDISKLITINKGQIFRSKEFVSIKKDIIENLLKEGYCSYDLDSKAYVYLDRHEVDVRFKLTKGDVCTFGKTSVEGLDTIDDSVVISRVRAREGERFNIERIRETRDEIYALDAFDSVSVRHDLKYYNVVP
ncbi:MAG: translocation/assembly module TamB domain-containing protein, partial [Sulfurovum sp.]